MSKLHINLPMFLYNELFVESVRKGMTMTSIVISALLDKLSYTPIPRAANDNQGSEHE